MNDAVIQLLDDIIEAIAIINNMSKMWLLMQWSVHQLMAEYQIKNNNFDVKILYFICFGDSTRLCIFQ